MSWDQLAEDSQLIGKRNALVNEAATRLSEVGMIDFHKKAETFVVKDLGRIAAKYYIRYASIEVFNRRFKPKMTEADVLAMLCNSTEVSSPWLRRWVKLI